MTKSRRAIMAFSQSEKIKAGLIWVSQLLQSGEAFEGGDRRVADRISQMLTAMVANEAGLACRVTGDPAWEKVERCIDTAQVMIRSGLPMEALHHLTQALTHVTGIGQSSMTCLAEEGLV